MAGTKTKLYWKQNIVQLWKVIQTFIHHFFCNFAENGQKRYGSIIWCFSSTTFLEQKRTYNLKRIHNLSTPTYWNEHPNIVQITVTTSRQGASKRLFTVDSFKAKIITEHTETSFRIVRYGCGHEAISKYRWKKQWILTDIINADRCASTIPVSRISAILFLSCRIDTFNTIFSAFTNLAISLLPSFFVGYSGSPFLSFACAILGANRTASSFRFEGRPSLAERQVTHWCSTDGQAICRACTVHAVIITIPFITWLVYFLSSMVNAFQNWW